MKPQAKLKTKVIQMDMLSTGMRPIRSDSDIGAMIKGPYAHARTMMETQSDWTTELFKLIDSEMAGIAGESTEDDIGEINEYNDTMPVT